MNVSCLSLYVMSLRFLTTTKDFKLKGYIENVEGTTRSTSILKKRINYQKGTIYFLFF